MSAALVRQALEFVDPDESSVQKNKKRSLQRAARAASGPSGQVKKPRKHNLDKGKNTEAAEEVVRKLLKLSRPTVDSKTAEKIVERAVRGKPLADKIEVNTEPEKSILFPDDDFDTFEEELFCS